MKWPKNDPSIASNSLNNDANFYNFPKVSSDDSIDQKSDVDDRYVVRWEFIIFLLDKFYKFKEKLI